MNLRERKEKLEQDLELIKNEVNKVEAAKQQFLMEALRLEGQLNLVVELMEITDTEE